MKMSPSIRADLHTHSTASDGVLAPAELVHEASKRGISILGLTDHDTTTGLVAAQRAADAAGMTLIPGIELSTKVRRGEIHILGYGIDPDHDELQHALGWLRDSRRSRAVRILDRLDSLGIVLMRDDILGRSVGTSVGRPHIAQAMIDAGIVSSVDEAFRSYLGPGAPAYVSREALEPADAVRLVRQAGGLAVFAHPLSCPDFRDWIRTLMDAGLSGVEVYYGEYSPDRRDELLEVATAHDLITTGGSDFHGPGFKEGRELGSVAIPEPVIHRFLGSVGVRP